MLQLDYETFRVNCNRTIVVDDGFYLKGIRDVCTVYSTNGRSN